MSRTPDDQRLNLQAPLEHLNQALAGESQPMHPHERAPDDEIRGRAAVARASRVDVVQALPTE